MSDLTVGRVEFCPKVCCGREVDIDVIEKKLTEKLEQSMTSFKEALGKDEKQVEKKSIYIITYECGKEIKQEKIAVESLEEVMDIITESNFVGFNTVAGKAIYIKTDKIIEIREYDKKQDELAKLTPEVKIKLPNEKDGCNLSKEEMAFMLASILIQRCKQ